MDSPIAAALRHAAASALPEGAFLRRDRGDALFVSNAPRLCADGDWTLALNRAGFCCEVSGGLLRLWPDGTWLARLEAEYPQPPDALCEGLSRFAGLAPEAGSLALFALGAKALEAGAGGAAYDKALRQRAALCLRLNRTEPDQPTRGGGLYACALLNFIIKEEETT